MVGDEHKAALADVVRAEEATGKVGRLVTYRGVERRSKYIQVDGGQAFLCLREKLQIWKGRRLK